MGALLYYLVILPISLLPYPVLYAFSDFLYLLIYYVVGYRKKIAFKNIRKSFPQLTHGEHVALTKKFYRHFCDLVVESLKIFTITEEEVKARMKIVNPEFINSYFEKGQSMILAGGHFNNWELFAVAIAAPLKHETCAIYQPLKNKFFDAKMRETRGKYGLKLISTKSVKQFFEQQHSKPTITIFAIDQSTPTIVQPAGEPAAVDPEPTTAVDRDTRYGLSVSGSPGPPTEVVPIADD
jgi:KDO2-lipid IV(A) lauroyltransferase